MATGANRNSARCGKINRFVRHASGGQLGRSQVGGALLSDITVKGTTERDVKRIRGWAALSVLLIASINLHTICARVSSLNGGVMSTGFLSTVVRLGISFST